MRCDFCGSRMVNWRYPAQGRDWLACPKCRAAIEADDRKRLLERVEMKPIPQALDDRFADKFRERAKRLHEDFWETRSGPAEPV